LINPKIGPLSCAVSVSRKGVLCHAFRPAVEWINALSSSIALV